jgi:hypothetical protein
MISIRTIKIYNVDKIVKCEIPQKFTNGAYKCVVNEVVEDEDLYTFHLRTDYKNWWKRSMVILVRHGGIWESMPYTPIYTLRDDRGEKLDMMISDIRDKDILLKRIGQLLEIGV